MTDQGPACAACGCTDENACVGGCSWVPSSIPGDPPICSRCLDQAAGPALLTITISEAPGGIAISAVAPRDLTFGIYLHIADGLEAMAREMRAEVAAKIH